MTWMIGPGDMIVGGLMQGTVTDMAVGMIGGMKAQGVVGIMTDMKTMKTSGWVVMQGDMAIGPEGRGRDFSILQGVEDMQPGTVAMRIGVETMHVTIDQKEIGTWV